MDNNSENKEIAVFSSKEFFEYAKILLPKYEFRHFEKFEEKNDTGVHFFRSNTKKRTKNSFTLSADSNVTDYYDINYQPRAFWIVEQPTEHITSIIRPIALLRWMKYKTPIIVSSFLDLPDLIKQENRKPKEERQYDMGVFFENKKTDAFLRLPFKPDKFISLLDGEDKLISLESEPNVQFRKDILGHALQDPPYSTENIKISYDEHKDKPAKKRLSFKILVIDNDRNYLKAISDTLTKTARNISHDDIEIQIKACSEDEVIGYYKTEYDIQAVFLDWQLNNSLETKNPTPGLLAKMKQLRPLIPVYILTITQDGYDIANMTGANYEGYFIKSELEKKPEDILNRIFRDFNARRNTPFWSAFRQYVDDFSDSWHTPGHSRGASFRESDYLNEFYNYWGDKTFASDLSVSVERLGSLLDSSNFIGAAQKKAAKTFGTTHTFFSTNGSSTSNKIMLQSIIKPKDRVIVDRNCHKSIHYACIQARADVEYLASEYSYSLGIFAPPSLAEIRRKLEKYKETEKKPKVIVITGCTYDGLLINVKQVVALAEEYSKKYGYKIKVFIDEAWFAYSSFHPEYYLDKEEKDEKKKKCYSAIRAGADYVTHSAHKVLSAFSQASYLHINDPNFDKDFFREIFYIYTSTSPQYQMIASLDVASMQMEMEGYKLVDIARKKASQFIDNVNKHLEHIKVLKHEDIFAAFENEVKETMIADKVGHDVLKVTLDFRYLKKKESEVLEFLREEGRLEIEKSTHSTVTILFTIGVEQEKINRLYSTLVKLDKKVGNEKKDKPVIFPKEIELKIPLYEAFYRSDAQEHKLDKLKEDIEKDKKTYLSSRLVTPYPPGIPTLVPGQVIKPEHIKYLEDLIGEGVEIHGCHKKKIYVIEY